MIIKRYAVYLANLDAVIGSEINRTRPVVVLSDDLMNRYLQTVVVCPLTTTLHPPWRGRIQVLCAGKESEIAADQIRTISKLRLIKQVDTLPDTDARILRQLITEMYGE